MIRTAGHAEVNAALAATARRAFPDSPLRFLGSRRHLAAVEELHRVHGIEGVELEELPVLDAGSERSLVTEARLFAGLWRRVRNGGVGRLVFCSASRRQLAWIIWLARRTAPVEVFVVLHESGYTLGLGEGGPLERLAHRCWFERLPENLTLLTFAPSVAEATAARFPFARRSLAWMWLPYLYPPPPPPREVDGGPVVFVSFGVAKEMKGVGDFLDLAEEARRRHGDGRSRFLLLGRAVEGAVDVGSAVGVEQVGSGGEMERSEIERLGRQAHWALFPYRNESYRFRSSGAIHDALACGVPVLGYEGPLLRSYFDAFGEIGELFDSYEGLEAAVRRAIEEPPRERHARYRQTLRRAVERLTPESLASQYRRPSSLDASGRAGGRGNGLSG